MRCIPQVLDRCKRLLLDRTLKATHSIQVSEPIGLLSIRNRGAYVKDQEACKLEISLHMFAMQRRNIDSRRIERLVRESNHSRSGSRVVLVDRVVVGWNLERQQVSRRDWIRNRESHGS